jgi:tRNA pseudouridine55 synthase
MKTQKTMIRNKLENKVNGILLLDKPLDITSNGALQRIKHLFCAKKAGHTGSLDPLATGMLPLCFGEATKISQYLLESDKYYRVQATLGVRTATGDAEGDIIRECSLEGVTRDKLEAVLPAFRGLIEQVPPMFSAIKFQGQPLYKLARQGIEIERNAREVTIHELTLESFTESTFQLFVHCTKGTYIRTLIDDIGEILGCGAHVSELRRTAVAPFQDAKMYSMEELNGILADGGLPALYACLLPLESSVQSLPAIYLATAAAFYVRTGQPVMAPKMLHNGLVRLFSDSGEFIGIGEMLDDGRVAPKRLLGITNNVAAAG